MSDKPTTPQKLNWICRLFGHHFDVAYDSEEGAPLFCPSAHEASCLTPQVVVTEDNLARVIAASKPLKQNATCIFCRRCGLIKEKD